MRRWARGCGRRHGRSCAAGPTGAASTACSAHTILDEALVAHVGFVVDGRPAVLPMTYGRVDDTLYLHGAVGNGMLRAVSGADVCVTVTLLDGLVLARAAMHHSMNYRCVVLYGRAERVDGEAEKRRAFDAVVEHSVAGRARSHVPPTTSSSGRPSCCASPSTRHR